MSRMYIKHARTRAAALDQQNGKASAGMARQERGPLLYADVCSK